MSVILASIPTSRLKPRGATRQSMTSFVQVFTKGEGPTANGNTQILPQDLNRVQYLMRNTSLEFDFMYAYTDLPNIDQDGFVLRANEALPSESLETLFGILVDQDQIPVPGQTLILRLDVGLG